jgi:hypothetical protein
MADSLYTSYKEQMISQLGGVAPTSGTLKAYIVKDTYTFSAAHEYLSDIVVGNRVGSALTLTSITTTDGTFDATDFVFTGVTGSGNANGIVIVVDTGVEATSQLVVYKDSMTNFPIALTGNNLTVTIQIHVNGIFSIG